jgi:hypothetical protein
VNQRTQSKLTLIDNALLVVCSRYFMAWTLGFFTGLAALIVPVAWLMGMLWVWAVVPAPRRRRVILALMGAVVVLFPAAYIYTHFVNRQAEREFAGYCERARVAQPPKTIAGVDWLLVDYWEYDPKLDRTHTLARIAWPGYMMRRMLLNGVDPYAGMNLRHPRRFDVYLTGDAEPPRRANPPEPPAAQLSIDWIEVRDTGNSLIGASTMVLRDLRTQQVVATQPVYVLNVLGMKAFPSLWAAPTIVRRSRFRSCPAAHELAQFVRAIAPPHIAAESPEGLGQ